MISCSRLSCGYPLRTVLGDIDLRIEKGEIIALLGPNGSGKSTLLKTLSKSLPALSGSVLIGDQNIGDLSFRDLARLVAFVPQEEHSQFPFTVREVVLMGRFPHSNGLFDSVEDVEVANDAMCQAQCADLADRSILELSGGEKQRVWIARALAQGAPILLLDEPSAHLDVSHQLSLIALIRSLRERGYAILAAIHDLNVASAMADRALLLQNGRVGIDAPIGDVLQDPLLEAVYHVRFERTKDSKGRVRLWPRSN